MSNLIEYDGPERRLGCAKCKEIKRLDEAMRACKADVDSEISATNHLVSALSGEVTGLRSDVHGLRGDVHNVAGSVKSMEASLSTIAATMTKLSDFPDAWQNITGFFKVMRWMRENLLIVAMFLSVMAYLGGKATGLIEF